MLNNFFYLNGTPTIFVLQDDLMNLLATTHDVRNILYQPPVLTKNAQYPSLKIKNTKFTNVSFSKTDIIDVNFFNCKFEDCLFIATKIKDCEFQNCNFHNCNMFKISFENTYVNPNSFVKCIKKFSHSNIAVHLFHELLNNSDEKTQSKFTRVAQYHFRKWQNRLTYMKFFKKQPYAISFWEFIWIYPINWLYKWTFGFGLRLRNFLITFSIIFFLFFSINSCNWNSYKLVQKDLSISSFKSDSTNLQANFLYTLDATTKIVDSQFQATSHSGMNWLTIENIVGFILLTGLVTIIFNRFIK